MISPELLRRHTFFGGFSAAELKELAMAGREQALAAGEMLFTEGARADQFYFLARGRDGDAPQDRRGRHLALLDPARGAGRVVGPHRAPHLHGLGPRPPGPRP